MEKEQKKLLLVAVSVGVFLLVTITAAIIILTPKAPAEITAFSSSHPYPAGRSNPVPESVVIAPPQPAVIEPPAITGEPAAVDKIDGDSLTIQIPKPTTAAVPDTPDIPAPAPSKPVVATVAEKPAPAVKPAPAAKTAAPVKPAAKPAAKPAPAKTTNDFWVQTGAFTARVRAEDAKETLATKGITSIIENRQVDGKTWYRVRLGPYTSEKEANYWLALVKSIDGFNESQVRQTVRQQ